MSQNKTLQMRNASGIGYLTMCSMKGLVYSNLRDHHFWECIVQMTLAYNSFFGWLHRATMATIFLRWPYIERKWKTW